MDVRMQRAQPAPARISANVRPAWNLAHYSAGCFFLLAGVFVVIVVAGDCAVANFC